MKASVYGPRFGETAVRYALVCERTQDALRYWAMFWKDGLFMGSARDVLHREHVSIERWTDSTVEWLAVSRVERTLRGMFPREGS